MEDIRMVSYCKIWYIFLLKTIVGIHEMMMIVETSWKEHKENTEDSRELQKSRRWTDNVNDIKSNCYEVRRQDRSELKKVWEI